MNMLMLPCKVVSPINSAMNTVVSKYGNALSCRIVSMLEPFMIYETGEDKELMYTISNNLVETLTIMCFNRLVESVGVEGTDHVMKRIVNHKFLIGISCRFGDIECLFGNTYADSIGNTGIIYDIYSVLTSFLEFISSSEEFKELVSMGLMNSLLELSSYRDYNLRNVNGSVMVGSDGILLVMRGNFNYG